MLTPLLGVVQISAETAQHHTELPMPAWLYGVGIMGVFLLLMLTTVAFTNLGNRHEAHDEHLDPHKTFPVEQRHDDEEQINY
ncbi:hypothetical protein [Arthrobacter castelli]|uniref:hypothetical protein n=1 Tax=Arthrobacter castelli TaxID=271431 RepID=UPI00047A135E|nr:hypothetical protein [Arthrobacter castelli]